MEKLLTAINNAIDKLVEAGTFKSSGSRCHEFFVPSAGKHGDLSTNTALKGAQAFACTPFFAAVKIADTINLESTYFKNCKAEEPGFLNFYYRNDFSLLVLKDILTAPINLSASPISDLFTTNENLNYYVKFTYWRICGILDNAGSFNREARTILASKNEIQLIKHLAVFSCTKNLAEHLVDLCTLFHKFYDNCRIRNDTQLCLCEATKLVLKAGFEVLDIIPDQHFEPR